MNEKEIITLLEEKVAAQQNVLEGIKTDISKAYWTGGIDTLNLVLAEIKGEFIVGELCYGEYDE